jgi:hypothetical protein
MKKIVFLFTLILLLGANMKAQLPNTWLTGTTLASTSATAVVYQLPVKFSIGDEFTVGGTATQVSGTSEGTVRLEESLTGTANTWLTVNSATYTALQVSSNDTVTIVNGTDFLFHVPAARSAYYRLIFTGGAGDATNIVPTWQYIKR